MLPVKKLEARYTHFRFLRFSNSGGRYPESVLLFKAKCSNDLSSPISEGMLPINWLEDKVRSFIFFNAPISRGITPLNLLDSNDSFRNWVRLPISLGINPESIYSILHSV